jgi:hypothetical protein
MNRPSVPLLLVLLCLAQCVLTASPTTGTREVVGPMTIVRPTEWTRKQLGDARVTLTPAAEAEVDISSTDIQGVELGPYHQASWEELGGRAPSANGQKSGRLAGFEWSEMTSIFPSDKKRLWCRLYTTKVGNDAVTVFVVMNSARAFRKLVAQVDEILSKAQFEGEPSVAD